ncbi:MAG: protein translocase subunit SecF [Acidobacteria bacterium]|nr:protein translocase subunit SecF [Acidobacteriota bacterium]
MSVWSDLYRERTDFDFPRLWPRTTALSVVLVLISLVSIVGIPLYCSTTDSCDRPAFNLSIDFEGGSVWEVPSSSFDEAAAEAVLTPYGPDSAEKFQRVTTGDGTEVLRISGRVADVDTAAEISTKLGEAAGLQPGDVTVSTVGPSWGEDITRQARLSLIVFLVLVALYIAWRLEARMAVAALVAVVHDVVLTAGVYSVFQLQLTPATVIAFLTILGFSLYDTIVVYDRVQENAARFGRSGRYTYAAIMRRSLNQVFMRSLNTTLVTVIPIVTMLIVGSFVFGQQTLGDFSLALLIGLVSGTYSSIFVAAPLTVWLKEREPRWRDLRARIAARGDDPADTAWYGLAGTGSGGDDRPARTVNTAAAARGATAVAERPVPADGAADADDVAGPKPRTGETVIPPRPRKRRRS